MKTLMALALTILLATISTTALADGYDSFRHHNQGEERLEHKGDRINHHFDVKGDRIEKRFDHKAKKAAERGHYKKAYKLKEKGERINAYLNRKGDRIEARFDHKKAPNAKTRSQQQQWDRFRTICRHHDNHDRVRYNPGTPWFGLRWFDI